MNPRTTWNASSRWFRRSRRREAGSSKFLEAWVSACTVAPWKLNTSFFVFFSVFVFFFFCSLLRALGYTQGPQPAGTRRRGGGRGKKLVFFSKYFGNLNRRDRIEGKPHTRKLQGLYYENPPGRCSLHEPTLSSWGANGFSGLRTSFATPGKLRYDAGDSLTWLQKHRWFPVSI